jgi:arginine deiminase
MTINDFAFACSIDGSMVGYFTYDKETMLIVVSEQEAKSRVNNFDRIAEPFMEALIAHESIHVVIKALEDTNASDSLDDLEVVVEHEGRKLQIPLNFIHYARDSSGVVLPF